MSTAAASSAAVAIADLLAGRRTVVLTGAGVSTDSGIPDYRGPHSPRHAPMTYAQFRSGPAARRRYWARSFTGWQRIRDARPNPGHHALAALQAAGAVDTIITQNVDGLHQVAGSAPVIDLHGRLDTVVCLDCGARSSRYELQRRLAELNPDVVPDDGRGPAVAMSRPDGDAEVADTSGFVVAACAVCGGVLKPDVVFFGENVPPARVAAGHAAVARARALVVAGSSLAVMSGLRFVRHAAEREVPIVIVNRGATRGDPLATLTVDAGCSQVLTALADVLDPVPSRTTS